MNKSKVKTPVLFGISDYGDNLNEILRKWFEFRRSYNTIYRFYMDSIYDGRNAIELSCFKLAAFLESYHREILEKGEVANAQTQRPLF
jgi:hypothetical protein